MRACFKGHVEMVQLLLDAGAELSAATRCYTALGLAAGNGHLAIMRMLLHTHACPNQSFYYVCVPLYRAAAEGHLYIVETLLEHGADVNQRGVLYEAIRRGDVDMVQMLLKYGAHTNNINNVYPSDEDDIFMTDRWRNSTPLEWARHQEQRNSAIESLLKKYLRGEKRPTQQVIIITSLAS